MSGLTNLIYFKDKLTSAEIEKITKLLENYGEIKVEDGFLFHCDFVINKDNSKFNVSIYSSDPDIEQFDTESKNEFRKTLGYVPKFYIGLMGERSSKVEEKFIANLALDITKIADGKIDFGAAIDPEETFDYEEISYFVNTIKGEVNELCYIDEEGNRWFTHVVDREFLANWVNHKRFYIPG